MKQKKRPKELSRNLALKVFAWGHPLETIREELCSLGFVCARDIEFLSPGQEVKIAGLVILIHTPPVRSGKRIMFVTLEDETGLLDLVIPPEVQKTCAKEVLTKKLVFLKGYLQNFYGNKNIVAKEPIDVCL